MPEKSTACYRSINHGRLYFAFTFDPIYHKSWLQSKKRTYMQVAEVYSGRILPQLQDQFPGAQRPDGSFEPDPELLSHLDGLPKADFIAQTRKKSKRVLHRPPGVLVNLLSLNDLPDAARLCDVSRVLGVAPSTIMTWRREGLHTRRVGPNVKIQREELRAWLVNADRLMT